MLSWKRFIPASIFLAFTITWKRWPKVFKMHQVLVLGGHTKKISPSNSSFEVEMLNVKQSFLYETLWWYNLSFKVIWLINTIFFVICNRHQTWLHRGGETLLNVHHCFSLLLKYFCSNLISQRPIILPKSLFEIVFWNLLAKICFHFEANSC